MPIRLNFRFAMKDTGNNQRYLACRHGVWQLTTSDLVPISLCNIAGDNAAKLIFALEDAYDLEDPEMARRSLVAFAQYAKDIEFI
jgi:hypothetical protein